VLGPTLGAVGCKLLLVEDTEATARIRARMKRRERAVPSTSLTNADESCGDKHPRFSRLN
jgi:hypothetical protein